MAVSALAGEIDVSLASIISRELYVVRQLAGQGKLALPRLLTEFNQFFSGDPLVKSRQDFIDTISMRDLDVMPIQDIRDIYPVWANSYAAAYSAMLVSEALRQLDQRTISLHPVCDSSGTARG
ncbi:hypothetical protein [Pseudomonas fontis]|uniref:Uncharacterized protein n=1 Tax=Pseudomonas fontis TaxID=2942633 RepID=A0ABT5NR15_9PSED|nr:hypothetical protein [Pseudomonas fontis]MDD0972586.1 hypothetical protein [Pseudomonas fontis]MDD0990610.1 hypothetical protein [Pseudomonas fontis]